MTIVSVKLIAEVKTNARQPQNLQNTTEQGEFHKAV